MGQRLTLKRLVSLGMDVWVVWDEGNSRVSAGAMDDDGSVPFVQQMTVSKLASKVREWWAAGFEAD